MDILVIEDEPTSLKLAHVVLTAAGHRVSEAEAAAKAIEAIKKTRPEVILMDLQLPDIDGISLTRRLKSDPQTKDIPIIAITGYPNKWSRQAAMEAGCAAYIVKPVDTRALVNEVAVYAHPDRR